MVYPAAFQDNLPCSSTSLFETIKGLVFSYEKKEAAPSHWNCQGLEMEFWFWKKKCPLTQAWKNCLRGEKSNWNAKFVFLVSDHEAVLTCFQISEWFLDGTFATENLQPI